MKLFSSVLSSRTLIGLAGAISVVGLVPSMPAADKPTIPIIVKDTTSFYWQIVLAGARQAGWDLGVNVIELGTDCESDINGQIRILATAVASIPAAIIIAPARY